MLISTLKALQPVHSVSVPLITPISTLISGQTLVSSVLPGKDQDVKNEDNRLAPKAVIMPSQLPRAQKPKAMTSQANMQAAVVPTRMSSHVSRLSSYVQQLAKGEGSMDGKGNKTIPGFRGWHPDHPEQLSICTDDIEVQDYIFSMEIDDNTVLSTIQNVQGDPRSIHKAQAHLDWSQWKTAIDKEIATLEQAGTWIDVEQPPGKNIVGSK